MAEIVIAKYLDVRERHILKMNALQKEKFLQYPHSLRPLLF